MRLAESQSVFTAALHPRCSTAQRLQACRLVRDNQRIPPELALRIYSNNVAGSLIKALTAAYPACQRILGEQCFNAVAHRYIEQSPSGRPDLNRYGATFGEFIDAWTRPKAQFADYRYLGDLARLEWLCHTAYYAEDNPPFDIRVLAEADPEAMASIRLHPGHDIGLLQSDYPVMAIRELNLSGSDAATVCSGELPEYLVVSRPAFTPQVERVDADTYALLHACRAGEPLGHIVSTLLDQDKIISGTIPDLIGRGWIAGVSMDGRRGAA